MKTQNLIGLAKAKINRLRDPETARVFACASSQFGAGWYDITVEDDTGDLATISSACTDIGSHAEAAAREIARALGVKFGE